MACIKCNDLNIIKEIRTPNDLRNALKVIMDNITDDTIKEVRNLNMEKLGFLPFHKIDIDGPWEDIICYYFECLKCHQKFCVHANTYHGSGGKWEPIKNIR